jgi:TP901 family phage tail tape measure protein
MADFETIGVEVTQRGARKTQQDLDGVTKSAQGTTRAFKSTEQAARDKTKADRDGSKATNDAARAQDGFNKTLTRSSGRLKVIGRDINRYFILPMTAMIGLSSRAALNLNEGMANVQALIPDTGDRIYELRDSVTDLASATGKSFDDITSGLYRTISVFLDNADTVDRLNTAIRTGIAGYASTAESVQLLSSVTRAYGDTSGEAVEKVADLAFETVRLGDTTIPQLSSAMQVATDRAVRLGISQEELFAVMATLTGITGDASMVATQFRSAMDSILRPTDELTQLLDEMGYVTAEAAIEEEGMIGLITAISRKAEEAGQPLQNYITRKEGVTLVSRLASEQLQDFNFRLSEIQDSTGAAAEAFENVTQGIGKHNFEMEKAKQRVNVFMAEIGENLLPVLVDLLQFLGDIIEAFASLPNWVQAATIRVTLFAGALSILFQLAGALKSLKVVALLGGIGKAAVAAQIPMAGLIGVLGTVGGVAVGLAGVAAVIGVGIVNANRKAAESAEESKEALQGIVDLQEDISEGSRRSESALSGTILGFRQEMQELDGIRMWEMRDGQLFEEGGLLDYESLEAKTDDEISNMIETFRTRLETLEKETLAELQETERELSKIVEPGLQDLRDLLTQKNEEYRDEGGSKAFFEWLFPQANSELFGENMSQNLNEILNIAQDKLAEYDRYRDSGIFHIAGEERYEETQSLVNILQGIVGNEDELNSVRSRIREAENLAAGIKASILELRDFSPEDGSGGGRSSVMTWQEWFAEVMDVPDAEFVNTGNRAAELFREGFTQETEHRQSVAELLGIDFDDASYFESAASQLQDQILELLSNRDIDAPFEVYDNAIVALSDQFDEMMDKMGVAVAEDFASDIRESTEEMDTMRGVMEGLGLDTDDYTLTIDDLVQRIEDARTVMLDLSEQGVPSTSSAFSILSGEIEKAINQIEALKGGMQDPGLTFSEAESKLASFSAYTKETLWEAFDGGMKGAWQRAADNLDKGLTDAQIRMVIFADLIGEVLMAVGQEVTNMFTEMGEGLVEGLSAGESMAESVEKSLIKLMGMLPQLMMMAGLQLLIANPSAWPIALGLIGGGAIAAIGVGAATAAYESENKHGNVFSGGTVQPFAAGGIVNRPTVFPMKNGAGLMGEAGPEAILPLKRGANGDLGVQASGGAAPVQVVINNHSGEPVKSEERSTANGGRMIEVTIGGVVKKYLAEGRLDSEMKARYGISRQGVR